MYPAVNRWSASTAVVQIDQLPLNGSEDLVDDHLAFTQANQARYLADPLKNDPLS